MIFYDYTVIEINEQAVVVAHAGLLIRSGHLYFLEPEYISYVT
jgi:hypothetical protein